MDSRPPAAPGFDAVALQQPRAPRLPGPKVDGVAVDKVAREFEGVFIQQMLSLMWETVDVDPNFGGGHSEEMFRGMMIEEHSKAITKAGGFGLADAIKTEMLRLQEVADGGPSARIQS